MPQGNFQLDKGQTHAVLARVQWLAIVSTVAYRLHPRGAAAGTRCMPCKPGGPRRTPPYSGCSAPVHRLAKK